MFESGDYRQKIVYAIEARKVDNNKIHKALFANLLDHYKMIRHVTFGYLIS